MAHALSAHLRRYIDSRDDCVYSELHKTVEFDPPVKLSNFTSNFIEFCAPAAIQSFRSASPAVLNYISSLPQPEQVLNLDQVEKGFSIKDITLACWKAVDSFAPSNFAPSGVHKMATRLHSPDALFMAGVEGHIQALEDGVSRCTDSMRSTGLEQRWMKKALVGYSSFDFDKFKLFLM